MHFTGFSQLLPVRNSDSLIVSNKVKSASSYFDDAESGKNFLIQKLDFDQNGWLISEYLLSLWDVVSYSHTTTYTYDSTGNVLEILKIQEILELFERDKDYIELFGKMPVNEKIIFTHNNRGMPVKKDVYAFHSDGLKPGSEPNQTITYSYEDGKLVLEESSSSETRIFNNNFSIQYDYDSAGNQIRALRTFGKEKPLTRETRYLYDSCGTMIEKIVIDAAAPHNNTHEKYEYDTAGNLVNLYLFSSEEKIFELETTYQYNAHGHPISGDRDVTYEYLDNGFIKSESWLDQKTEQTITFNTTYNYY